MAMVATKATTQTAATGRERAGASFGIPYIWTTIRRYTARESTLLRMADRDEPHEARVDRRPEEEELSEEPGQRRYSDERDQEDHHRCRGDRPRTPEPCDAAQVPPRQHNDRRLL